MSAVGEIDLGKALGTDYFLLRSELTEQETDYIDRTRQFVDEGRRRCAIIRIAAECRELRPGGSRSLAAVAWGNASGDGQRGAHVGSGDPKNMLNFPKPTARRRFGKSSMTTVLNFPNASRTIGFGKLSRYVGVHRRHRATPTGPPPQPAPFPGGRAPCAQPGQVGHPVPNLSRHHARPAGAG
jgi:hypothetical protein